MIESIFRQCDWHYPYQQTSDVMEKTIREIALLCPLFLNELYNASYLWNQLNQLFILFIICIFIAAAWVTEHMFTNIYVVKYYSIILNITFRCLIYIGKLKMKPVKKSIFNSPLSDKSWRLIDKNTVNKVYKLVYLEVRYKINQYSFSMFNLNYDKF